MFGGGERQHVEAAGTGQVDGFDAGNHVVGDGGEINGGVGSDKPQLVVAGAAGRPQSAVGIKNQDIVAGARRQQIQSRSAIQEIVTGAAQ